MNEEIQAKAFAMIEQLASKLGVAAEHLWEVLVRQQYVNGFQLALLAVFSGGASFALYKLGRYCYKRHKEVKKFNEWDLGGLWSFIGTGATAIAMVLALLTAVGRFLNPEYYALIRILDLIQ